jgi:hypothetical protein
VSKFLQKSYYLLYDRIFNLMPSNIMNYYWALIIFVLCVVIYQIYVKTTYEHLTPISDEAIQNVASLYNTTNLTATNVTLTNLLKLGNAFQVDANGNITTSGNITAGGGIRAGGNITTSRHIIAGINADGTRYDKGPGGNLIAKGTVAAGDNIVAGITDGGVTVDGGIVPDGNITAVNGFAGGNIIVVGDGVMAANSANNIRFRNSSSAMGKVPGNYWGGGTQGNLTQWLAQIVNPL